VFNTPKKYSLFVRLAPALAVIFMLAAVVLHLKRGDRKMQEDQVVKKIEENLGQALRQIEAEVRWVEEHIIDTVDFGRPNAIVEGNMYIFYAGQLLYWSSHEFIPEFKHVDPEAPISFVNTENGDYLYLKNKVGELVVLHAIPLYTRSRISNQYLQPGFNRAIFPIAEGISIMPEGISPVNPEQGKEVLVSGKPAFKIIFGPQPFFLEKYRSIAVFVIVSIAVALTWAWWWLLMGLRAKSGKFESSFLLWALALGGTRFMMLLFDFPGNVWDTGLFSSVNFASSSINPSLGDMLLNTIIVLLLGLFVSRYLAKGNITRWMIVHQEKWRWLISLVLFVSCFFLLSFPHHVVQTIYHNSQITMDVTKTLSVGYLRVISLFIYVISAFSMFFTFSALFRLLYQINKKSFALFALYLASGVLTFIMLQVITNQHFMVTALSGTLLFLFLFKYAYFKNIDRWKYTTFLYIFTIAALASIIGAYGIYEFEIEREQENKEKFADNFLIRNDNLTEFYLDEVNSKVKRDLFITGRFSNPLLSKEAIAKKIRQKYLHSFFDKYDVEISLFSAGNDVLFGEPTLDEIIVLEDEEMAMLYATDYEGIFFINRSGGDVVRRYVDKIPIERRGLLLGYVMLDLKLKTIIPNDVYFELLVDNRFFQPFLGSDYSYAVFTNTEITYSSGDFNYGKLFPPGLLDAGSELFTDEVNHAGFTHIGMRDNEGRIIVVSSAKYPTAGLMTNFSFLFLIQIFILLLMGLALTAYLFYQKNDLTYSARIQLFFNLSFFVPLLMVSFITLNTVNTSFREEVGHEHRKKANTISANIIDYLEEYQERSIDGDAFDEYLTQAARFSDADVNMFDMRGHLISSSRPLIYENNLISEYINPRAYAAIVEEGESDWVVDEKVGKLKYRSNYVAVKSFRSGEVKGILSVPFFESELHLERQQIEVFSNIINIFTLVLILFFIISYFVSKGLTFPLRLITHKLKRTTLTGFNEPVKWDTDDEIGLMVSEYNRMLLNLEDSKAELAKSQKESAWREIAQQVAHEIKNPLTPMKLTLQHMERKIAENSDDQMLRPIHAMLHHVETLDDIATSFSSFAKMPIPEIGPFELVGLIHKTMGLYKNRKGVKIQFSTAIEEVIVQGDQQLMGRIFSNILLNAIQSVEEDEEINILISLTIFKKRVLIEVRDDGSGIDDSIKNKVFVPNFTTKTTGSGIGLAIAKHGIEHSGGKIWFETAVGAGTSFFIELPLG